MTTSTSITKPVDPADPWTTVAGPQYDISKYYMKSTDGHGHGSPANAKISTGLHGEISALIATRKLPYKTISDFMRDAAFHRARYLAHQFKLGKLQSLTDVDLATQFFEAEEDTNNRQRALVDKIERNLAAAAADGDWARLDALLDETFRLLGDDDYDEMDMSDFHRTKLGEIFSKHRKILSDVIRAGRALKAVD